MMKPISCKHRKPKLGSGDVDIRRLHYSLVVFFILILSLVCLSWAPPVSAGWTVIGLFEDSALSLAIDPVNTQTIYAGTSKKGVYKSTTGGVSWSQTGLQTGYITALVIDPNHTNTIYAAVDNGGLFKSTDGGTNWTRTALEAPFNILLCIAIDPSHTQTIYAGGSGIYKSTDGGINWELLLPSYAYSLAIDPKNNQVIYAAMGSGGLLKSYDGGTNWGILELPLSGIYCETIVLDPVDNNTVYLGGITGSNTGDIFKSTNGGMNWTFTGVQYPTYSIAINPKNSQIVFVATSECVYKSTNATGAILSILSLF
jgi:photosystem II stability/assembly factor-like uncharacterized protein